MVPRDACWIIGKPQPTGRSSISANGWGVGGSAVGKAIKIADISRMCLAEGHGALIRSRLNRMELFRVGQDENF
jgi:hypothetical protein